MTDPARSERQISPKAPTIEVYDADDNWLSVIGVEVKQGGKLVITVEVPDAA